MLKRNAMIGPKRDLARLIRGAMGEIRADLIISGGRLLNVYSGEILDEQEIAVLDGRICYVGPSAKHARGQSTELLDAGGMYVAPGFIDGHTHIGHYCRPYEYLQAYVARGTTAVVATCDELATVFGFPGLRLFLDEVEAHPIRVFTLVSMVAPQDPLLCSTALFTDEEVAQALQDPRVFGLGEIVSWLRLIQSDEELLRRIEMAHRNRQIIHGHTAGARDQKLCAVASVGISSCHEPIGVEDAIERLRLGYWTMLREGSLRQDLEATLKPLIERRVSFQRLILVTDSVAPDDARERGQMDYVVRRAVSLGMPAMQAIQAATLNPATYSGLEQEIGGIAPGRCADFVLLDDLEQCHVRETFIGGKMVADKGVSLVEGRPIALPSEMMHCLNLRTTVSPLSFKVPCPVASVKIRVMELINQTITAEKIIDVNGASGFVEADVYEDLLKVAVFDRHGRSEIATLGFLKGLGLKAGAVATTANLDENTLLVVGSSDSDMALCANTLIECGGGIAIADRGQILEKIEFPFGGIFSLYPWQEVGKRLSRIQSCLRENGSTFDKPLYAMIFLTFVTLPALRITARGLINAKERKIVSLFAD